MTALGGVWVALGLAAMLVWPALGGGVASALGRVQGTYGPSERFSLDGAWEFQLEQPPAQGKPRAHLASAPPQKGWKGVRVPSTWGVNAAANPHMRGQVGWYRKDFTLPSAGPSSTWLVRFQSVNSRLQAWLNGHFIGSHTGAYLPFQLVLPDTALKRRGVNRLLLRVDDHRLIGDFPGMNLWWNYGGILRPVELQRVDRVGFTSVQVLPQLPCPACPATIAYRIGVRNYTAEQQTVHLRGAYGALAIDLGIRTLPPRGIYTFVGQSTLAAPHLWWPQSPYLYDVRLSLSGLAAAAGTAGGSSRAGRRSRDWQRLGSYALRSGVRSVAVAGGVLQLNGEQLNVRGTGLIEDSPELGGALDEAHLLRIAAELHELGGSAIRSQYPLDERLEEIADRQGILLWSEAPVDTVPPRLFWRAGFRQKAVEEVQQNVLANSSHPSVIVWSIGNELRAYPDAGQSAYIAQAVAASHALDPTRPVGLAFAGYPGAGCQAQAYAPLEVLGVNDYFGWYSGPKGELADRNNLSGYLDFLRACYPTKALMVTEFGAEASHEGSVTEPGSYAFQQEFVKFHLEVFASKPWLSGAFYWALQEFRVRPGWTGGNPRPTPPMHRKGLVSFYGYRKPAFYEAQRIHRSTEQIRAAPAS